VLRAAVLFAAIFCTAGGLPDHVFVAYHDSWNERSAETAQQTSLASLPTFIDPVLLAFAKPDAIYGGDLDIANTGLEYRMPGRVLREAITILKRNHPGTHVLVSVGGAAYRHWEDMRPLAIAALVRDFGLDGVDVDYEPPDPACAVGSSGHITCNTDAMWSSIVHGFRAALPRPMLLTASVWSVGAFGEGDFRESRPRSAYTGIMLPLLLSPFAADLDLLSIDAYDAGPTFDPLEAFRAYRAVWSGRLALGVEVRWPDGVGPFYSPARVEHLAHEVIQDPRGGMMLYPLLAMPKGGPIDSPDGTALAQAVCRGMRLRGCEITGQLADQRSVLPLNGQNRNSGP
jgi:chitinase